MNDPVVVFRTWSDIEASIVRGLLDDDVKADGPGVKPTVIIAHHDTVIEADDHVIVFLTDRRHVESVERLFQE